MAGVTRDGTAQVRAPIQGDGEKLVCLWRQLWELHETWGGYASSRDENVYASIAQRIDEHTRLRDGDAILGPHIHLVGTLDGRVVGQIEGWCERLGGSPSTPITCDIRSLIVSEPDRSHGLGGRLIAALEEQVTQAFPAQPLVFAAEVHAENVAARFYERLGFRAVAFSCRLDTEGRKRAPQAGGGRPADGWAGRARPAGGKDAAAVVALDTILAERRQTDLRDPRFDAPTPFDPNIVEILRVHLANPGGADPRELVATSAEGELIGSATFAVGMLEPPFVPKDRAMLGRFAVLERGDTGTATSALIEAAVRMAQAHGARHVELADLDAPGQPLYETARASGALPWSTTYVRFPAPSVGSSSPFGATGASAR